MFGPVLQLLLKIIFEKIISIILDNKTKMLLSSPHQRSVDMKEIYPRNIIKREVAKWGLSTCTIIRQYLLLIDTDRLVAKLS